jgi:hypothetical protein
MLLSLLPNNVLDKRLQEESETVAVPKVVDANAPLLEPEAVAAEKEASKTKERL